MKLTKKLIKKMEENDFTVTHEDGNIYYFSKYSPAGQDFGFSIDTEDNLDMFANNILAYYQNFDVSQEAYYWLDESGHGRNGAPYEMNDVYKDMEECEKIIYELYEIVTEYAEGK